MSDQSAHDFILWESIQDGLDLKIKLSYGVNFSVIIIRPKDNPFVLIYLYRDDQELHSLAQTYEISDGGDPAVTVFSMLDNLFAVFQVALYQLGIDPRPLVPDSQPEPEVDDYVLIIRRAQHALETDGHIE